MPQFVVLHHEMNSDHATDSHWDLMLEDQGVLLTWALPLAPTYPTPWTSCRQLPDHRIAYLDYEGLISGDRGQVLRIERGVYEWIARTEDQIRIMLQGQIINATLHLRKRNQRWSYHIEAIRPDTKSH